MAFPFPGSPKILLVCGLAAVLGCGSSRQAAEQQPVPSPPPSIQVLGPGGGGSQYIPTIDPSDSSRVFVRCDMTGAYVTENGGRSWRMFHLRGVVRDFEFDPLDPKTVYASNTALYRSEDRGVRWSLVYPSPQNVLAEKMVDDEAWEWYETADRQPDRLIEKVRVDPANSDRIYLGLAARQLTDDTRRVRFLGDSTLILLSTDRGRSWRALAQVYGREVLAICPGVWDGRPEEVTVVTDRVLARIPEKGGRTVSRPLPSSPARAADCGWSKSGSMIYVLTGMEAANGGVKGGVYRSADRGENWEQVNQGLLEGWRLTGRLPAFSTLAVCEGSPQVAYLACAFYPVSGKESNFGILRTADSGASWRWVCRADGARVLTDNYDGGWAMRDYGPDWGGSPVSLGVSPADPDVCYATDSGCTYRSLDGGVRWEQVYTNFLPDSSAASRGLDVTTCYGVHFDPFDPQHLFVSYTDIGAFHSFNGGRSWLHSIEGVPREWINTCYWMAFDPSVKGRAWSVWGNGHDLPRSKMFAGDFDRFLGGAALSEDGCRTWRAASQGIPSNTDCTHILLDPESPADSRTLYVCGFGKGVFKSTDGGATWKNSSAGLGSNLNAWRVVRLPDGVLYLLVARGLEGETVVDGKLYRSADQAGTWTEIPLPAGVNAPNDLVFDPSDPKRMYLCCWPWPTGGVERGGGVLRTEDGGATWTRVFAGDAHVYAAALDPENPSTVIISTFDSATFRSDDRGATWYRLKGFTFKWGHRPVFDPHKPGMLYLTTFGGSVFYGPAEGIPGLFEGIDNFSDAWRWGKEPNIVSAPGR